MKRLFLGVSPTSVQREQLLQLQEALFKASHQQSDIKHRGIEANSDSHTPHSGVGRRVDKHNFHMTLAFLGAFSDEMQAHLELTLDSFTLRNQTQWPAFDVTLDTLTLWPKPQVLCLSGKLNDANLQLTVDRCRHAAKQAEVFCGKKNKSNNNDEWSFIPHITLFRKAKQIPENNLSQTDLLQSQLIATSLIPMTLSPQQMHLYESLSTSTGVEYHILRSWALVQPS